MISVSKRKKNTTSTGKISSFTVEIYHQELQEYKIVTGKDREILKANIHNAKRILNEKWDKQLLKVEKDEIAKNHENKIKEAEAKTHEYEKLQESLSNILTDSLDVKIAVDWDKEKQNGTFNFKPKSTDWLIYRTDGYPQDYVQINLPVEPLKNEYFKKVSILNKLLKRKEEILKRQKSEYDLAINRWHKNKNKALETNQSREKDLRAEQEQWLIEEEVFDENQKEYNLNIDEIKGGYRRKSENSIRDYCKIVLRDSIYPIEFKKNTTIQFSSDDSTLQVDYNLPNQSKIPKAVNLKYIKSRGKFQEKLLTQSQHNQLFDSVIYQICLRTLYELFSADKIDAIKSIIVNGRVTDINTATGHEESKCIVAIRVEKDKFTEVNLSNVDARDCFKLLKGVSAARLSNLSAIQPKLGLNMSDKRFIDYHAVSGRLNEGSNIAAMHWEDFEHLVAELFDKEFSSTGGKVELTQSSNDGGIDAVGFNLDPLFGGKYIIQAKRYTKTVGVAAVRDLYGTCQDAGANKGILVSTADFSPAAYTFADDKPLQLFSGSELLGLLEKHGIKARINLSEARKVKKGI